MAFFNWILFHRILLIVLLLLIAIIGIVLCAFMIRYFGGARGDALQTKIENLVDTSFATIGQGIALKFNDVSVTQVVPVTCELCNGYGKTLFDMGKRELYRDARKQLIDKLGSFFGNLTWRFVKKDHHELKCKKQ